MSTVIYVIMSITAELIVKQSKHYCFASKVLSLSMALPKNALISNQPPQKIR